MENAARSLDRAVRELVLKFTALWWESNTSFPTLGPTHTVQEQAAREKHLRRFLDALTAELKSPLHTQEDRQGAQARILAAFATFANVALGFEECHLDILLAGGFSQATVEFAQAARRFDPSISSSDIFQAGRNAWTMHGLQVLFGLPVQVTPAVVGYSLLYPYTDNYLDDPSISEKEKAAFNERFTRRLTGESIVAANAREQAIFDLVGMIETQYDRSAYPRVFASLLAIHRAQERSVRLLRPDASPYEVNVLALGFEKGGTSILADAYLVTSDLSPLQAQFAFGWGVLVQLADDLQDVQQDSESGLLTPFSQTAKRWPLDGLTSRTLNFALKVVERLNDFYKPNRAAIKELLTMSITQLIIDAAGQAARFYTRDYLKELEAFFPFRFSVLSKYRRKLARQRVSLVRLIEAFAGPGEHAPIENAW